MRHEISAWRYLIASVVCVVVSRATTVDSCDFEIDFCQWTPLGAADAEGYIPLQWRRNRGRTLSVNTGPSVDNTTGSPNGSYVYIETSRLPCSAQAVLASPYLNSTSDLKCSLSMAYHMYGSGIGTLEVIKHTATRDTVVWSLSGDQGNQWKTVNVNLGATGSKFQVHLKAIHTSGNYTGDIALDDVSLQDCPPADSFATIAPSPNNAPTTQAPQIITTTAPSPTTTQAPQIITTTAPPPTNASTTQAPQIITTTAQPPTNASTTQAPQIITTTAPSTAAPTTQAPRILTTTASKFATTAPPPTNAPTTQARQIITTTAPPPTNASTTQAPQIITTTAQPPTNASTTQAPQIITTTAPSTAAPTTQAPRILTTTASKFATTAPPPTNAPTTQARQIITTTAPPPTNASTTQAPQIIQTTAPPPTNASTTQAPRIIAPVRLVGGFTSNQGRVEVRYGGTWGTICDDLWGILDSQVACRQLGFSDASTYQRNAFYGQGNGRIWMDGVNCSGHEKALSLCQFYGWGITDCTHADDVGVVCTGSSSGITYDGDIRLVGGSTSKEGRVEISQNGTWGTVCDNGFTDTDAKVVCRQLGYSTSKAKAYTGAHYGQGTGPIWLVGVACAGDESRLSACNSNSLGTNFCDHGDDVGVDCNSPDTTSIVAIAAAVPVLVIIIIIIAVVIGVYRYRRAKRIAMSHTLNPTATTAVSFSNQAEPSSTIGYHNPLQAPSLTDGTAKKGGRPPPYSTKDMQHPPSYPPLDVLHVSQQTQTGFASPSVPQAGALNPPPQAGPVYPPSKTRGIYLPP